MMKQVHIIGGGTVTHVRSHFSMEFPDLKAKAAGNTAKQLAELCLAESDKLEVCLHLTRMAGGPSNLETPDDVKRLLDELKTDPKTKIIFMNAAICDFSGEVDDVPSGKDSPRLSSKRKYTMILTPTPKIISTIRDADHKDIFLVGFKMTCGMSEDEQYIEALHLLKSSSCNLVLANDSKTRLNMVVTPEEARYHVTTNREEALKGLVEMAYLRSHLTFTRSTVVEGTSVPWSSTLVPESIRKVVDHCIKRGAYKEFRGATVGHFAIKVSENIFLTSKRKTNFNHLDEIGLVKVVTDGPDSVIAYGSKPSVGGNSQRIVFHDHQEYDCVVHFHSPIKPGSKVPVRSQREFECGSHQCGSSTSQGLQKFGNLSTVYLDQHGPNIVFHRSIDPQEVIDFIEANFDLEEKTGGYVSLKDIVNTPKTVEWLSDLQSKIKAEVAVKEQVLSELGNH